MDVGYVDPELCFLHELNTFLELLLETFKKTIHCGLVRSVYHPVHPSTIAMRLTRLLPLTTALAAALVAASSMGIEKRDADFYSVRTQQVLDSSQKDQHPAKYFRESSFLSIRCRACSSIPTYWTWWQRVAFDALPQWFVKSLATLLAN